LECKERERNDESAGPRLIPTRRHAKPRSRDREAEFGGAMLWLVDHPVAFFVTTLTLLIVSARVGVALELTATR
jgi:hypothetical protein